MSRYLSLQFVTALYVLLTAFICCSRRAALAQEDAAVKSISVHVAESVSDEEELSALTERLSFYRRKPIDLNQPKPDQLKELAFLSPLQISNLYHHIRLNGKLKDVLELQAINGFDPETILRLLPFVSLKPEAGYKSLFSFRKLLTKGSNELLLRYGQVLKKQKGFRDLPGSRYLGSPQKLLMKYKYQLDDLLSFSLTADKDAGERLGIDFLSMSLALYKNGRFRKIIIGDYSLQFGQGLTLWTGSSFGKGADVAGVAKKDTGLKPYTSADEFSFFRGVGSSYKVFKIIDLTSFISLRDLDASLSRNSAGQFSLTTIGKSGLHRTPSEIKNKRSLRQLLYGLALQLRNDNLEATLISYHSSYEHEFSSGEALYRQHNFQGKELSNLGIAYNYNLRNIYVFGETAKSAPGGIAVLQGAMSSLSKSLSVVLLYRNYAKNFFSFYSQGVGAGSSSGNEQGWYGGLHFTPNKRWDLSLYADLYRFPWARYRIDSASTGAEFMGMLSYQPQKKIKLMLKLSHQLSEQNLRSDLPKNPLAKVNKDNCRLAADWQLNRKLKFGNRFEVTSYRKGSGASSYGYLVYQDADYSPLSSRLAANTRIAWFNTPTYENRIYAYEDDVLYGAGSGLYNGRGFRFYLNMNYSLSRQLKAWARYAVYYYPGKDKIGSGLDEINGTNKPEIRLQLRYQF